MANIKVYTEVIYKDIDDIVPYWNNPRDNAKTREALVDAYREIGFNQPILIDQNNVIVKGHARYHACRLAGMEKVPVIVSKKSDKENREDRILDNGIQDLSTWDYEGLKDQLKEIDMSIAHISTTEEIMEGVNTEIEDEDDPIVFLTCPNCGKKHQIPKSELLAMEVVYGDEAD